MVPNDLEVNRNNSEYKYKQLCCKMIKQLVVKWLKVHMPISVKKIKFNNITICMQL